MTILYWKKTLKHCWLLYHLLICLLLDIQIIFCDSWHFVTLGTFLLHPVSQVSVKENEMQTLSRTGRESVWTNIPGVAIEPSRNTRACCFSCSSVTSSTLCMHWLMMSSRPIRFRARSSSLPVAFSLFFSIHWCSTTNAFWTPTTQPSYTILCNNGGLEFGHRQINLIGIWVFSNVLLCLCSYRLGSLLTLDLLSFSVHQMQT